MLKLQKLKNTNDKFYETISHSHMIDLVKMCGLSSNADLFYIKNYIKGANSILEIGAGYGRVIDFMLTINPHAQISAIEYSSTLCKILRNTFRDTINLIEADITKIRPKQLSGKFDLITWMWGSIIDIDSSERLKFIKKTYKALNNGGTLVIDAPKCNTSQWENRKSAIMEYMDQHIGETHCFDIPAISEMSFYERKLKDSVLETIPYTVKIEGDNGDISYSERYLYCFKKFNKEK